MQITIVEAEIKTAITDYILSQLSVNANMEIDIDLRATRGVEGYQAIIDIRPKAKLHEPVEAPANNLNIKETVTKAKAFKKPAAEPASEPVKKPEVQEEESEPKKPKATPSIFDKKETPEETAEVDVSGEALPSEEITEAAAPSENEDEPEPKAKPKSIFGDLKRPVNA